MAKTTLYPWAPPEIPTVPPKGIKKDSLKKKTDQLVKRLGELQHLLYAEGKHSVLIILQGMDASGKKRWRGAQGFSWMHDCRPRPVA